MAAGTSSMARVLPLIIGGVCLGVAATTATLAYWRDASQSYSARLEFRVLAPESIGGDTVEGEIESTIQRAESLLHSPAFLEELAAAPEFKRPPNAHEGESRWKAIHRGNEVTALRDDLSFLSIPIVNGFEISMRGPVAEETTAMLSAAASKLQDRLDVASREVAEKRLQELKEARAASKADVEAARDALATWAKARDVDVARSSYDIEKSALQQLNAEAVRVNALVVLANAKLDTIKQLLKPFITNAPDPRIDPEKMNQITVTDTPSVLKLTPEMHQQIENDPTLRSLESQRLTWQQELVAEQSKPNPILVKINEIRTRVEMVSSQISETRSRLLWQAADHMLRQAVDEATAHASLRSNVDERRAQRSARVLSIGNALTEYQVRVDELKAKEDRARTLEDTFQRISRDPSRATARVQVVRYSPASRDASAAATGFPYTPVGVSLGLGLVMLAVGLRRPKVTPVTLP